MTRAVRKRSIAVIGLMPLSLVYGCSLLVGVDGLTTDATPDAHVAPAHDGGAGETSNDAPAGTADDGAIDATQNAGDTSVADASPIDTGVVDASTKDAADSGLLKCKNDLSNVGAGDFHIAFGVTMTQSTLTPLLNQRDKCSPAVFWDVREINGNLQVEVDDVNHFNSVTSGGVAVNDGTLHVVFVQRVSGTLTIQIDGTDRGSVGSDAILGALPPLATGTDVCLGQDGTVAFTGSISGVCVTNH